MYYTAQIFKPEEGFGKIIEAAGKFNMDRFIYAIGYKNWNEEKIERLGDEVSIYRRKLDIEYKNLVKFAECFNKQFATPNNKCFETALHLLKKLRSGISETKKLFLKFCPRARYEKLNQAFAQHKVSAYEYAYISTDSYQLPLLTIESFPPQVMALYREMEKFFITLVKCLQLCLRVIKDERIIKADNEYCAILLEQFKEKIASEIYDILVVIPRDSEFFSEEKNPAIASRNRYATDKAWASEGFHNHTIADMKFLVIKQMLEQGEDNDLTNEELLLFGNDKEQVHRYRNIIQHFDELLPPHYKRKHLPAKVIQMFFQFVKIPDRMEKRAAGYFNSMYRESIHNKLYTVDYTSINGYKKEVIEDRNGEYKDFVRRLQARFFITEPQQTA